MTPRRLRKPRSAIKGPSLAAPSKQTAAGRSARPAAPSLPPLVLSVKRSTWRKHDPQKESADAAYARVRLDVLRRDAYTCRYCGFTSHGDPQAHPGSYAISGYLEVHHKDDNHRNNRPDNLITVCPFCHQVFHVGNAGHRAAAQITWCPWLPQNAVNLLCNIAAIAIARQGRYAAAGQAWFQWLGQLQAQSAHVYGDAIMDASNLGMALMACAGSRSPGWVHRAEATAALRLIPRRDVYEAAIRWWADKAWRPEEQWESVLDQWTKACAPR